MPEMAILGFSDPTFHQKGAYFQKNSFNNKETPAW